MTKLYRPEGLRGDISVREMTEDESTEAMLKLLLGIRQENIRQSRMLYDHSRPIEEYAGVLDPQPAGDFDIMPSYSICSKIDNITASIPVGTTAATLFLGTERIIPLYAGTAATTQIIVNIRGFGALLTDNDRRFLRLAGTMTTGFFIMLSGYAQERYGNG